MTKQLSVCCLLEDDYCRSKRREGHIQTTASGEGFELRGEVLQVSSWRTAQEQEHVVVETLRSRAIHNNIGHRQHLEKKGR